MLLKSLRIAKLLSTSLIIFLLEINTCILDLPTLISSALFRIGMYQRKNEYEEGGWDYEIITVFPSKTTFYLSFEEMCLIYLEAHQDHKQYTTIFWFICQECLVFTIYSSCNAHFFEKVLTLYDAIQPQALSHKIIQFFFLFLRSSLYLLCSYLRKGVSCTISL